MPRYCKYRIFYLVFTAILFFLVNSALGQTLTYDGLGFFWYIEGSRVVRIDANGKEKSSFSNIHFGNPASIDASDPFRILVFYPESQSIIVLNNNAVLIGKPIYLPDLGLGEVTLACRSARGGAWLYHRETAEILRIDQRFATINQRTPFPAAQQSLIPNFLTEQDGVLYLGVNNKIIIQFDIYGAQLTTLPIPYQQEFRVQQDFLWVSQDNYVKRYHINNLKSEIEIYICECSTLPVLFSNIPSCFDGKRFKICKKISPKP